MHAACMDPDRGRGRIYATSELVSKDQAYPSSIPLLVIEFLNLIMKCYMIIHQANEIKKKKKKLLNLYLNNFKF